MSWSRLRWVLLVGVILAGHAALWASPRVDPEAALRLTLMNAGIWAVILLPAIGVTLWARAHRRDAQSVGAETKFVPPAPPPD